MSTLCLNTDTDRQVRSEKEFRLWGLGLLELHDRYWASRGVRVSREHGTSANRPARGQILLQLPPNVLAFFDLNDFRDSSRRLSKGRKKPARRHDALVDRLNQGCILTAYDPTVTDETSGEIVESDAQGNFLRCRRSYGNHAMPDLHIIELTATSADSSSPLVMHVNGSMHRADGPDIAEVAIRLLHGLHATGANFDDVREIQPGVWAHETAQVHPSAMLIAPVLVGTSVTLDETDVVGPCMIPDQQPGTPLVPIRDPVGVPTILPTASSHLPGKRLFDILFSVAALLLTAPLYVLISIAIWIEDGRPVYFAHKRQTLGGRTFNCWKFRTMRRNTERLKPRLNTVNECDGPHFLLYDDPRLFRVGRFLRQWRLDELPQFFNVLRGDMSVVGPRPSPDTENQFCPAWREIRLSVRAGITGLWQVCRTREPDTDFQEWIQYDDEYVKNMSWRQELSILLRTLWVLSRRERATQDPVDQSTITESKPLRASIVGTASTTSDT